MKYFAPPIQRSLRTNFLLVGFSHVFTAALSRTGLLCGVWCGTKRRAVESVKCLIGTQNRGRHLTYPNVCAHHECRIRKHFLIKRKFVPLDSFGQVKYVHRGFHGPMRINLDLNSKRHDIVGPDVLFLSKTTRCNDTLPVKSFLTVRFWMFFKEFSSAHQACIYLIQNTAKAVILWNIFYYLK